MRRLCRAAPQRGGQRLELAWPELAAHPNYGLVRPRADFDERRHAFFDQHADGLFPAHRQRHLADQRRARFFARHAITRKKRLRAPANRIGRTS